MVNLSPVEPTKGTVSSLTDANAVNAAMREFKKLGRTEFLKKYGYGRCPGSAPLRQN